MYNEVSKAQSSGDHDRAACAHSAHNAEHKFAGFHNKTDASAGKARKSRFSFWKSCAIIALPNSFSYTEEETNMTIAEIRALGLMEEAVAELSGGDDKAEIVRASLVCPLCGMAETVWYCPATDKHVCVDCHYVW